jgi:polysaccharide export outer membrane protein
MKRLIKCAFGSYFLIASVCGSPIFGQTAAAIQAVRDSPGGGLDAPPAQPPAAPKAIRTDETFIIGNDDVLAISVWKEPDLTKQIPVRSDGKISLPLLGDIQAAGRTPSQLEQDITEKLKSFITDPQVAVIVQQINSLKFNILGQVIKPGAYPLTAGTTIVDAIATAGGFKDFAKKKGVYILRQNPGGSGPLKYDFNYQDFIKGKNTKQNIMVKPHDTIIVP